MADPTLALISIPPSRLAEVSFYTPKYITNLSENITFVPRRQIERLTPIYITDVNKYMSRQSDREHLEKSYSREELDVSREVTNPYENVGRSIFMNRAGVKMANLDAIFKLTGYLAGNLHYTTPGQFYFVSLAEAPGAFAQYILWRRPDSRGYTMSLRDGLEYRTDLLDLNRLKIFYGANNTGNLMIEWQNLINLILNERNRGVDLVTADGGIATEGERAEAREELLYFELIVVQIFIAIKVLQKGGRMVVKMFDTVNELTAQLLYLVSQCFDRISLIKPLSSRPNNNERYLVAEGRRDKTDTVAFELILEHTVTSFNKEEWVVNMLDYNLPVDFTDWLTQINDSLSELQAEATARRKEYLTTKKIPHHNVNLYRAIAAWQIPAEPITKYSLIKVPGSGTRTVPYYSVKRKADLDMQ